MTAEQLWALRDDGHPRELVKGELRMMTPAGFEHGRIVSNVHLLVAGHAKVHDLGAVLAAETGFTLSRDPDTVRAPDVAFVRKDRVPPPEQQSGFVELAPDLIVEVLSPTDRPADTTEKIADYLDAGVSVVWVLDPRTHSAMEYLPGAAARLIGPTGELAGGDVLPGFSCAVAELFD